MARRITVLAGGVGAARFLEGLAQVVPQSAITVIGNTADDLELHGLAISPDLDTVMYTLAGLNDPERGWGRRGETFHCLQALEAFSGETWFQLGDRDLATHLYRTARLRGGAPLDEVTGELCGKLGVEAAILPMTNDKVRTWVAADAGWIDFQTYFVKNRAADQVSGIEFRGAEEASPAPGVIQAIYDAEVLIVAPSNPMISIRPILSVPGIREALRRRRTSVVAVSPLVGGRALKGPTVAMMRGLGLEASARQVAMMYADIVSVFVVDELDRAQTADIASVGLQPVVEQTVMRSSEDKAALAGACLRAAAVPA